MEGLTSLQQTILVSVQENPGQFSRSGLAKLLVGSSSSRAGDLSNHPAYGRLSGYGRKAITFEIDILIQQQYLALDRQQKLVLTPGS